MMTDVTARRKQNEEVGCYHVHIEESKSDVEFVEKQTISEIMLTRVASDEYSLWDEFYESHSVNVLPSYERTRKRMKSTLLINGILGAGIFLVSSLTLAYCYWSYKRITAYGLRSVLFVLIAQGLSLTSTSFLGLNIYKDKNPPSSVQLFFTVFLVIVGAAFLAVNFQLPDTDSALRDVLQELDKYKQKYGNLADNNRNWCCSINGFVRNCYNFSESSASVKDITFESDFDSVNGECFKLMGWALAETMIKSCSCFLVPALFVIILISALIHYGSSSNAGFVDTCGSESCDKDDLL